MDQKLRFGIIGCSSISERSTIPAIQKSDFADIKIFQDGLNQDLEYLQVLKNIWYKHTKDPKYDKFLDYLMNKPNNKVVIFTEYTDTLDYLEKKFPAILKAKHFL